MIKDLSGQIEIEIVTTEDQLRQLIQALAQAEFVAIDTETTSLNPLAAKIVGIPLAINGKKAWYIPIGHVPPQQEDLFAPPTRFDLDKQLPLDAVRKALLPALQTKKLVLHNAKYDYLVLRTNGFVFPEGFPLYHDTMLASRAIDPGVPAALKWQTERFLKRPVIRYDELRVPIAQASIEDAAKYSGADPANTYALFQFQQERMNQPTVKVLHEIEMPLLTVLADMEADGVLVDTAKIQPIRDACVLEIAKAKADAQALAKELLAIIEPDNDVAGQYLLDLDSPKKLSEYFNFIGAPVPAEFEPDFDDPDASFSTNKNVLATIKAGFFDSTKKQNQLLVKLIDAILSYRQHEKIRSTYIDSLMSGKTKLRAQIEDAEAINPLDGGRLHTSYKQLGAKTGRMASAPNLQNLPKNKSMDIRGLFIPDRGKVFVKADWNAIELRIAAYVSNDPTMKMLMRENKDLHAYTAALVHDMGYEQFLGEMKPKDLDKLDNTDPIAQLATERERQRNDAKTTSFLILYGGGARKLALNLTTTTGKLYTQAQCQSIIDGFLGIYKDLDKWLKRTIDEIKFKGFAETLDGRRLYVGQNPTEDQVRTAVNFIIQGSAADKLKISLVKADRIWKRATHKIETKLHVHDEIVAQCDENDAAIQEAWNGLNEAMTWKLGDIELTRELQVVRSLSKTEKSIWEPPK